MSSTDDEFERLKSYEKTVENILDEKLSKFGDCFRKAKKNITHVQILDNYGRYYLKKVHGSFKNVLQQFNIDDRTIKTLEN